MALYVWLPQGTSFEEGALHYHYGRLAVGSGKQSKIASSPQSPITVSLGHRVAPIQNPGLASA